MHYPSLEVETALWHSGCQRVAGVDEVGLGCLAGPVVAAAVLLPVNCTQLEGVRDSKKMTPRQREAVLPLICQQAMQVTLGAANLAEIERLNVRRASHLAMQRALGRLGGYDHALIDGSPIRHIELGTHTTIIKGDCTCYAIACASIVAKVWRDRMMARLASRHPGYGWQHNCGYGTAQHLAALQTLGVTSWHRRNYRPVQAVIKQLQLGI